MHSLGLINPFSWRTALLGSHCLFCVSGLVMLTFLWLKSTKGIQACRKVNDDKLAGGNRFQSSTAEQLTSTFLHSRNTLSFPL